MEEVLMELSGVYPYTYFELLELYQRMGNLDKVVKYIKEHIN